MMGLRWVGVWCWENKFPEVLYILNTDPLWLTRRLRPISDNGPAILNNMIREQEF